MPTLVDAIEALLPQTQCTRCGYAGCMPYAQAIANRKAGINRCPPGGSAGIAKLAVLLGRPIVPLDESCGSEKPLEAAIIDESTCIGCAICIEACPVDAIVGAAKQMHTVVQAFCTGCELCIAPCPVDCIAMAAASSPEWTPERAAVARGRYEAHRARIEQTEGDRARRLGERTMAISGARSGEPK